MMNMEIDEGKGATNESVGEAAPAKVAGGKSGGSQESDKAPANVLDDILDDDDYGLDDDEPAEVNSSLETGEIVGDEADDEPSSLDTRVVKEASSDRESEHESSHDDDKQTPRSTIVAPSPPVSDARPTRYFIMKSNTQSNFDVSVQRGIWATQHHNEFKLNEAFKKADVVLVFSVNTSGAFQGYCKMTSRIGEAVANVWEGAAPWGGSFKVAWKRVCDLPFQETHHLRNPLNLNKPVKISRDGQELPPKIGRALCNLFDEIASSAARKRKPSSDKVDEGHSDREESSSHSAKRSRIDKERPAHSSTRFDARSLISRGGSDRRTSPLRGTRPVRTASKPSLDDLPRLVITRSVSPPRKRQREQSPQRIRPRPPVDEIMPRGAGRGSTYGRSREYEPKESRERESRQRDQREREQYERDLREQEREREFRERERDREIRDHRDDRDRNRGRDRPDRRDLDRRGSREFRDDSHPSFDMLDMTYDQYLNTLHQYKPALPTMSSFATYNFLWNQLRAFGGAKELSRNDYAKFMSSFAERYDQGPGAFSKRLYRR